MEKDALMKRRFVDLAETADRKNQYTFTAFLSEAELSEFMEIRHEIPTCGYTVWGGHPDAERTMIRFGSEKAFGYAQDFPIVCVRIEPLQQKFADLLTHRDFLGAIMHLGIKRSEIGDIMVAESSAYVFCTETIGTYLCHSLERIRHTSVRTLLTNEIPATFTQITERGEVQVASERADGVIAKIFHLSRSDCQQLFHVGKVFVNGRATENTGVHLKEGDKVSVRGYGKFRFTGIKGQTRKGNLIVQYERFSGRFLSEF